MRNSYVLALHDCTRIRQDLSKERLDPSMTAVMTPQMMALYEAHNCFKPKEHCNIIQSYMYKPTVDIKAKHVNNVFYFKHIMLGRDKENNVYLPERIASYKGTDKNAEYTTDIKQKLIITWKGTDYGQVE